MFLELEKFPRFLSGAEFCLALKSTYSMLALELIHARFTANMQGGLVPQS